MTRKDASASCCCWGQYDEHSPTSFILSLVFSTENENGLYCTYICTTSQKVSSSTLEAASSDVRSYSRKRQVTYGSQLLLPGATCSKSSNKMYLRIGNEKLRASSRSCHKVDRKVKVGKGEGRVSKRLARHGEKLIQVGPPWRIGL